MPRPFLNDDERALRRSQLLAAAHELFRSSRQLPSVAAIAQAAGVAKGSVYLSFGSKEEIFIALLEDSFASLLGIIVPGIRHLPADAAVAAERFSSVYANAIAKMPDLLPLAGMTNAVLEKNLPVPVMLAFKGGLATGLGMAATALAESDLALAQSQGVDLLLRTWSMTLGLWQALDIPKELRAHVRRPPLDVFDRNFSAELTQAVRAFWLGSLMRR